MSQLYRFMQAAVAFMWVLLCPLAFAEAPAQESALSLTFKDAQLKWGPCPDFIPKGCEIAVLHGDPTKNNADVFFKLFWGLRGGGNFGVVTAFKFRLQPVGPQVMGGMILYPLDKAAEVLKFFREFTASTPEELGALAVLRPAPPAPFLA